jgi:ParB family chromosome partitioning protein
MQRKTLGKGLAALIPHAKGTERAGIVNIPISQIKPNPYQPRKTDSIELQNELIASIKEKGIIQPILVRKKDEGYEIIAGERRYKAAKSIGLYTIPAIIKEATDSEVLELALIENIQRKDLTPIEEANAYRQLIEELSLTQEELAKRLGKNRATIANALRLLKLPIEIQNKIETGEISTGHAIALLMIEDPQKQIMICNRIINEKLSVRETERLIKSFKPRRKKIKQIDVHIKKLEEDLSKLFGTRVKVEKYGEKGKIIINFFSLEDLERIVEILHHKK